MGRGRLVILISVMLVIGFGMGFILRPIILPTGQTAVANGHMPPSGASAASRGTQYFEANIDEARQVVAACRNGSVRGDECINAESAIITVESKERFKRFRAER